MNKFLLAIGAAALACGSMSAETITFDFVNNDYGLTRLSGTTSDYIDEGEEISPEGVTFTFSTTNSGANNESGVRLWSDGLRFYNGGSVTVSSAGNTITGIRLLTKTGQLMTVTNMSIDDVTQNEWTGSKDAVQIKYTATTKNTAVAQIEVSFEASGDTRPAADISFEENEFVVNYGDNFTAPALINPHNLPVTWTSSEETVATVSDGNVTVLGVGTTTISASFAGNDEYRAGTASYRITVVKTAESLAEWFTMCPNSGDEALIGFPLTVIYKNGANAYVTDGYTSTLLYGSNSYLPGDVLATGWVAKYSPYSGLPEIVPGTGYSFPEVTGTADVPEPEVVASVTAEDVNRILVIQDVTFDEATPANKANFTGTLSNGESLAFRNNFIIESVEPGTYNVTVAVALYNTSLQVYPIAYQNVIDIPVTEPTVLFDGNPEKYYIEDLEEMAFLTYVADRNGKGTISFEGLAEGMDVYFVNLGAGFMSLTPEDLEQYGTVTKLENNALELGIGAHYLAWWYSHDGVLNDDPDGECYFCVDMLNAAVAVAGSTDYTTEEGSDAAIYERQVTADDATVTFGFEGLPEWVEVYAAISSEGAAAVRRIPADELATEGFAALENNEAEFGIGDHQVAWYYVFNGKTIGEQPETVLVKVTKGTQAGVDAIASDAEAEYFNLQGVKVENPDEGLYIRVSNGNAAKVLVK